MEKTQDEKRYIWLDLETTGLDPTAGEILELAMFATDAECNQIGSPFECVFKHPRGRIIDRMDDYVLEMHLKSGLLKRVYSDIPREAEDANRRLWTSAELWLARTTKAGSGGAKNSYLAGNSIHFDRSWLAEHRPFLLTLVSHRMLDVSSFLIVRPDLRRVGEPAHRAMADAQESASTFFEHFHRLLQQGAPLTSTN